MSHRVGDKTKMQKLNIKKNLNKRVVIALVVIVLILGAGFLVYQNKTQEEEVAQLPSRTQEDLVFELPESEIKIGEIPENAESIRIDEVIVDNFYQDNQIMNDNGDVSLATSEEFGIVFLPQYNLFIVSIIGSPFEEIRSQAEQALLQQLEVNEEEACKLNVVVNTPVWANEEESGITYPLSFCE